MRITVAGLEAMKAITGKPDPTDGRQTLVDLTPTGLDGKTAETRQVSAVLF